MHENSLHTLLRMKSKNSIMKSVYYVPNERRYIIKTQDSTFENLCNSPIHEKLQAQERINKYIRRHMHTENLTYARVTNYSLFNHHKEYYLKSR